MKREYPQMKGIRHDGVTLSHSLFIPFPFAVFRLKEGLSVDKVRHAMEPTSPSARHYWVTRKDIVFMSPG